MLDLVNVSKNYGKMTVLEDINLSFSEPNGVYGLLGRNGAGKTTMMKMIFNMIVDYRGDINYQGESVRNNASALGQILYVGGPINQNNSLFNGKIKRIFKTFNRLYPEFDYAYAVNLLDSFGILEKNKYKSLSTGNKTLVQNILGLATRVPITIMDEPTNGLDSVNRHKFFQEMMRDYEKHPRMFILSTHLINEVQNYLTHVIMLKDNHIILNEPISTVQEKAFQVGKYNLANKNLIHQESLGTYQLNHYYDQINQAEIDEITQAGGEFSYLDLQTLFNDLMEGSIWNEQ